MNNRFYTFFSAIQVNVQLVLKKAVPLEILSD